MRFTLPLLMLAIACGGATDTAATTTPDTTPEVSTISVPSGDIDAALAGAHRSDEARARDTQRHPKETLAFFGLQPEMTVVEVHPGGGWYTSVLAPYLRDGGRLIAGGYDPDDEGPRGGYERGFRSTLAAHPNIFDRVEPVLFVDGHFLDAVPDGSVDMVLTFRSIHNMMRRGAEPEPYFEAMARVLRPGGVLGVVQHRAHEGLEHGEDGTLGYLTEARVIALAEAAGLVLDARSEINANPNDTHDHPDGVWSMPPGLRGGDESLAGLGESDRMTLRFVKPEEPALEAPSPEAAAAPEANEPAAL